MRSFLLLAILTLHADPATQHRKADQRISDQYRKYWRKTLEIEQQWRSICESRGQVLSPIQGPELLGCVTPQAKTEPEKPKDEPKEKTTK